MSDVKPGWRTSEFWLASIAKLIGIAYASGLIHDGSSVDRVAGLAVVALATLGYSVSRGMTKASQGASS